MTADDTGRPTGEPHGGQPDQRADPPSPHQDPFAPVDYPGAELPPPVPSGGYPPPPPGPPGYPPPGAFPPPPPYPGGPSYGPGAPPYGHNPYGADPYGPNPYDPNAYGPGPFYDPYQPLKPPGTNGKAIGAMVSSVAGFVLCLCFVPSIVGIVLGVMAMNETKRTGQDGRGLALAAVVIGAGTIVLYLALFAFGFAVDAVLPSEFQDY